MPAVLRISTGASTQVLASSERPKKDQVNYLKRPKDSDNEQE
jgi:hypothetical protein